MKQKSGGKENSGSSEIREKVGKDSIIQSGEERHEYIGNWCEGHDGNGPCEQA